MTGVVVTTASFPLAAAPRPAWSPPHPATRASTGSTGSTNQMRLGTIPRTIADQMAVVIRSLSATMGAMAAPETTDATAPWPLHATMPPVAAPSSVTLVQGRTFVLCDRGGDID